MNDEHRPLLPSEQLAYAQHTSSSAAASARRQTKRYLTSKTGHYSVLALVSVDISSIFADLILQLLTCEGRIPPKDGDKAQEVLGILSLVFSCLFMLELLASIWAFGLSYAVSFACSSITTLLT